MGFDGLGMANSKSGDYNLFSPGKVLELLKDKNRSFKMKMRMDHG